jgi:hypothetical protein
VVSDAMIANNVLPAVGAEPNTTVAGVVVVLAELD